MGMYLRSSVLLIVATFLNCVSAINVLGVFDIPVQSQQIIGHELMLGLAKRGYNVTLISSYPVEKNIHPNYTHVYLDGLVDYKESKYRDVAQGQSKIGMFAMVNAQINFVNVAMQSKNFQDFLKSDSKYDVIIQTYLMNEAYLGLAEHFNARVIGFIAISSFPHINSLTGNTAPYSYVPLPFLGYSQDMTFMQRTMNTIAGTIMMVIHKCYMFPQQDALLRKYFPNTPSLEEIQRDRVDLIFSNVHFSTEQPIPRTPNIVYIGGYHVQKPEVLPGDLQKLLDSARDGVAFLSLGSNVLISKLPKEKEDAFVKTLSKSPYVNLIKYDSTLANQPKNIHTSNWYPQRGILAHSKTKIFIGHGGKGGTTESMYFGVPTLCVSIYGDQKKNCEEIVEFGMGIHLPLDQVTEETFAKAFKEITTNPKYQQNAKYRAALFREQEMDPLDRASFWINHVHKFKGAKHLKPKSADMPLYQYLLIDVWLFILSVLSVILIVLYKIGKFTWKKIFKSQNKQIKIKRN